MRGLAVARCGRVLAAVLFFAGLCSATPITVLNPSFELLPYNGLWLGACGAGCSWNTGNTGNTNIPDWKITTTAGAGAGEYRPGSQSPELHFNYVPNGLNVAYNNGGELTQQLQGVTVQMGRVYTMLVDLGWRIESARAFTSSAALRINGVDHNAAGHQPTRGNWSTYSVTYAAKWSDVGKPITIALKSGGSQADFDNVRMSVQFVPEPGTTALAGLGLLLVAGVIRRFLPR